MKSCGVLLLYALAFMLIGHGFSLRNREAITLGLFFACLAVLATGWTLRGLLRLPDHSEGLAEMAHSDPFQKVGLALAETAPYGEKRLTLHLNTQGGTLHARLEGSSGFLPVPQTVLASLSEIQKAGRQLVSMRWTVTREEDGEWAVNVTFL